MYVFLMVLAILCNTLVRYNPFSVEISHGRSTYYIGQAASFLMILIACNYKQPTKANEAIYRIAIWLSVSNLMDELFFDPLHLGVNEIIFAAMILLYEIFYFIINGSKTGTY